MTNPDIIASHRIYTYIEPYFRVHAKHILFFILATLLNLAPSAGATWSAREINAMPPYCSARYNKESNPTEYKSWEQRYGPDFLHVHHLCNGIGALNRAYQTHNPQQRRGLLTQVISEFSYVMSHVSPDFILLSDLYLYRSEANRLQNNYAAALSDAIRSISINPAQTRAYLIAADLYTKQGQENQARSVITDGLRRQPTSQSLIKRLKDLGGDPDSIIRNQPNNTPHESEKSGRVKTDTPADPAPQISPTNTSENNRRYALYSFSRIGYGGMKHGYNAGNYVYLEVSENPKRPDDTVLFRIISQIPEPHSRIQSIAFDLGKQPGLFLKLEPDLFLGQYYSITRSIVPYTHPFWPGFQAHFYTEFKIDPKIAKPNDPRRLSPGNALTITAYLQPGVRYEDVIKALNHGLQSPDGLRVAIIAHHLAGAPLPSGTRSDDGGYFTGRLIKTSSPSTSDSSPTIRSEDTPPPNADASTSPATKTQEIRTNSQTTSQQRNNSSNPWCRFCPTE